MTHAAVDPRPRVVERSGVAVVAGARCTACGHPTAFLRPRCPDCRGPVEPADFGPEGSAWSSTVVRIPVAGRSPFLSLALASHGGYARLSSLAFHYARDAAD